MVTAKPMIAVSASTRVAGGHMKPVDCGAAQSASRARAMIFKITTTSAWDEAVSAGAFRGSEHDKRDGYIHFSAAHQLAGTAAKYFRHQPDLLLVAIAEEKLGHELKWEPARGADFFPHLYAPLPTAAALWTKPLALDSEGVPIIPEDIA